MLGCGFYPPENSALIQQLRVKCFFSNYLVTILFLFLLIKPFHELVIFMGASKIENLKNDLISVVFA